jgi:hypothetical protein
MAAEATNVVPLKPDPAALHPATRKSFHRACAAMALAAMNEAKIHLKQHWHGDDAAERVPRPSAVLMASAASKLNTITVGVAERAC